MSHSTVLGRKRQIALLRTQFAQKDGLPFADVLPVERLETALHEAGASWRDCVFTPVLTLWAFLSQVISADGSCRSAVARVLSWLVSKDETPCSSETGPYCKARQRLPEKLLVRLTRETGQALHGAASTEWRWKGRRVKIVDGTTVSMPDTPANQNGYPQTPSQKPGLGFPIARMVVVFCLATGSVLDAALGRYEGKRTGENSLLRTLEQGLASGDVVLADRCFCGYFDIAWWQERGVDMVTRLHQRRHCDLRRGAHLGPNDHIVVWTKPKQRPEWMDADLYARMPEELYLREVRVRIGQRGFRTKQVVVVTTLCDYEEYSASDLAKLYRARWHAELDLRSLKTTLGMDVLRCKTPAMVRKEVWAHLLAYNLIRTVMAQAAKAHEVLPRQISFKGVLQTMQAFADRLLEAAGRTQNDLYEELLMAIVTHAVGNRPNRIEPRARKRRPKEYDLLTVPREVARKQLLKRT
jgi:IS4 transposase